MKNDLINREALINAVEVLYEYAELGEVLDVIKAAPTVEPLEVLQDNKTFTREELKAWLYAIAINNLDGLERDKVFADDCKEIIDRLDGFERFVKDRREGKI